MFNAFEVESARLQYEREIASASNLDQFAPVRRSVSERIATRIINRRQRRTIDIAR